MLNKNMRDIYNCCGSYYQQSLHTYLTYLSINVSLHILIIANIEYTVSLHIIYIVICKDRIVLLIILQNVNKVLDLYFT